MNLWQNIINSFRVIRRSKMRSFLTMLGIIIGVAAVIIIMSVGEGAKSLIFGQITSSGSNLVAVLPGKSDDSGPPASVLGIVVTTLTDQDAKAIENSGFSAIAAATSYLRGADTISVEERKSDVSFVGVNADYLEVEDTDVASGQFFSPEEEGSAARLAIIGSQVAKDLFPDQDPIGKTIRIKQTPFVIEGVMKERGSKNFQDQDSQIFVPVTTAQKILLGVNYVNYIRIKVTDADQVNAVMDFTKNLLRERHNIDNPDNDDFSVRSTAQGLEILGTITTAITFFLAAMAAISLLVGGIGIMNVMLASVQERVKEIGLRKALGARSFDIVVQFLVETIMVTLTGGIIGIFIGVSFSYIIYRIVIAIGQSWAFVVTWQSMAMGIGISILIGVMFGILPAQKASQLDPIEALRYE